MRRVTAVMAILVAGSALVACEDGHRLAVENRCTAAIEVDFHDIPDPVGQGYSLHWASVEPGATTSLGSTTSPDSVYLWIRAAGSDEVPEPTKVDLAVLIEEDGQRVEVIEGTSCPAEVSA